MSKDEMTLREKLQVISMVGLTIIIMLLSPANWLPVILAVVLFMLPTVVTMFVSYGMFYVLTGLVLRPWVNKWITWLKEQPTDAPIDLDAGPWLPKFYIAYLIRLGPALAMQQEQQLRQKEMSDALDAVQEKRKRKRRRAGRGTR